MAAIATVDCTALQCALARSLAVGGGEEEDGSLPHQPATIYMLALNATAREKGSGTFVLGTLGKVSDASRVCSPEVICPAPKIDGSFFSLLSFNCSCNSRGEQTNGFSPWARKFH